MNAHERYLRDQERRRAVEDEGLEAIPIWRIQKAMKNIQAMIEDPISQRPRTVTQSALQTWARASTVVATDRPGDDDDQE